jgi:hypothetical protein
LGRTVNPTPKTQIRPGRRTVEPPSGLTVSSLCIGEDTYRAGRIDMQFILCGMEVYRQILVSSLISNPFLHFLVYRLLRIPYGEVATAGFLSFSEPLF